MNKKLIINADDFGYDDDAVEGILQLIENQKISSTTILANYVKSSDLKKINGNKNISVGLHLNLISGEPLSKKPKVGTLINNEGLFYKSSELYYRFLTGRIKIIEIETEISNQVKRLKESGILISHADSHQHIHQYPFFSRVILKLLKKHGIKRIRNCMPTTWPNNRMKTLKTFTHFSHHELQNFFTTDGLIPYFSVNSQYNLSSFDDALEKSFKRKQVLEIMTHPGTEDRNGSYLNRKKEFNFWMKNQWKEILVKNNIDLINFHQL